MTRFLDGWKQEGLNKILSIRRERGPVEADDWIEHDGRHWRRL